MSTESNRDDAKNRAVLKIFIIDCIQIVRIGLVSILKEHQEFHVVGDAADITDAAWHVWNIDLSTVGGNLSSVTSLTIGIEGAGATGVVYIDDIRLYP